MATITTIPLVLSLGLFFGLPIAGVVGRFWVKWRLRRRRVPEAEVGAAGNLVLIVCLWIFVLRRMMTDEFFGGVDILFPLILVFVFPYVGLFQIYSMLDAPSQAPLQRRLLGLYGLHLAGWIAYLFGVFFPHGR